MIDDVLDVDGDATRMGKRVGTDLLDGNPSLPIVRGLALPEVHRAFTADACTPELASSALTRLRSQGIPERIREEAVAYARQALGVIRTLPASEFRDSLSRLVGELVERQL